MALRKIVYEGDPLLRRESREIAEITDHIRRLADDLWDTMYEANGVGLAAPQVGVLRRLAVIDVTELPEEAEEAADGAGDEAMEGGAGDEEREDGTGDEEREDGVSGCAAPAPEPEIIKYVLINPEIVEASEETVISKEGCLSVPGLVGHVKRPAYVKVRAMGIDGMPFEVEGEGMLAKALQHEIDHLKGVLYTDIAESVEEVCKGE